MNSNIRPMIHSLVEMSIHRPTTADAWFLTGPTASGKTAVALELARRLDAEIISMDSMALYRGLDIGTAKPTLAERAQAPHHLLDRLSPDEEFSLASYVQEAAEKVAEICGRGRQPLFVGGTPLYLKALLRGIFQGPPADWQLRRRLEADSEQHGPTYLHERLQAVDPIAAQRLHANDTRRIIRALEVYEKLGQPISELQQQFETGRPANECHVFVLQWPKAILHQRIERRVDAMFATGLVEEVRGLLDRGQVFGRTAGQALGYREVIEHLHGKHTLAETVELVKLHTKQFAKRQQTWFRSLSECRLVAMIESESPLDVATRIVART